MIIAPPPSNEQERLADLRALNILDTPPEARFDQIVELAALTFGVPMAYIAMVDSDRQWFKAKCGLNADETGRDVSFCSHTILQDEPLIIPDATSDPRFTDNPLVTGEPFVRFYAGHPLKGPRGTNVGTLCLADKNPHNPKDLPLQTFGRLANLVEHELSMVDLIRTQHDLLVTKSELLRTQEVLRAELAEAAEYVRSLLPEPLDDTHYRSDWVFESSSALGGDCFGYHLLEDGRLALYMVDIMGHGVGAALLASSVQTSLRRQTLPDTDFSEPGSVLRGLNRAFPMDLHNDRFFTAWYGVLCPRRQTLRYVNAGHPPVALTRAGTTQRLSNTATMVGVVEEEHPDVQETELPAGSRLLLYSDGAYEVTRGKDMLGVDGFFRLIDEVQQETSRPSALRRALTDYQQREHFDDDLSLLEIEVRG